MNDSASPLTQHWINGLEEYRSGLIAIPKASLSYQVLYDYDKANEKNLAGVAGRIPRNHMSHRLQSLKDIDDVDVLDDGRDKLVKFVDDWLKELRGEARVRPILSDLIVKVKDTKLATLLREFNDAKDGQPNLAAIGLRTILCLIIQERAKISAPTSNLATTEDLSLGPMLERVTKETKVFPSGETKLIDAFKRHLLKEGSDNVVHKPGTNMLVDKGDLTAAVDLLNKLIPTLFQ